MTAATRRRGRLLLAASVAAFALGVVGCSDSLGPEASADHAAVFDDMWQQFNLHYSFFDLKKINWDSLGAYYRPLAVNAPTDQAFAQVLSRMLNELRDVHVSLTPAGSQNPMRYLSPADTATTYFNTDRIFRKYVPGSQATAGGHVQFGLLAPTVGYLRIATFADANWGAEVDAALEQLKTATRLVIDVRNNPGGEYTTAADIAGRFADHAHTFGYVRYRNGQAHDAFTPYTEETVAPSGPRQFTGPVYVLTDRRDFSSAEDFVMAMRVLPNTTVVGDTTAGASGGPIVREAPNGWTYQLSEWIEYTSARQTFEGAGLVPGVVVKPAITDAQQDVDAILARALSLALGR